VIAEGSATGSATDWSQTTAPIDTGAPDSGNWSLAAVTLTDTSGIETPALEITGDTSDDDSAEAVLIEHWKDDGVGDPVGDPDSIAWTSDGSHAPSATFKLDIPGVEGGETYYAAVTYVVSGAPGDRLVLGPVTAGSTDISGAVNPLVDAATAKLAWKQPVRAKTTAALAANTYANGTSGVGATLTANANGALAAQDGVTLVAGERLLVADEATGSHNGIYTVTQVGDASHPYILTRTTDADTSAKLVNATVKVSEGTAAADQEWQCTTNATITVGTTALVWEKSSVSPMNTGKLLGRTTASSGAVEEISVGSGLSLSAGSLSATGGGGGGSAAWTELAWYDFAVSGAVASVEADTSSVGEVLVMFFNTSSSGASSFNSIQVSFDGGTTWKTTSGDYQSISGTGTGTNESALNTHTTSTTSGRTSHGHLLEVSSSRSPKPAECPSKAPHVIYGTGPITRVRAIKWTGAATTNFTGGTVVIWGR
jgi:hypothetical protein